jgi:hypothetical protein
MNWTDKTVIRILLMVAKFIARDDWKKDVEQLSAHISVGAWKEEQPQATGTGGGDG